VIGGQLPPTPVFPPNISNQNCEIPILFNVVDFQIENRFLRRTLPKNPQGKGFKLCPGAYKTFVVETSKQAHSVRNSKG